MKTPPTIAALSILLSASICFAQDLPKFEKLKLKTGREYDKVTVTEKRPDGISISHESGTARLASGDLPDDAVNALGGFDAVAAAEYRDKIREAQNEQVRAAAVGAAVAESSKSITGRILQVLNNGVLLENAHYYDASLIERETTKRVKVGGPSALHPDARPTYRKDTKVEKVERGLIMIGGIIFVACPTNGLIDGASFNAVIYPTGPHSYTDTQGAKRTIKGYTTNKEAFLRRKGLDGEETSDPSKSQSKKR